VVSFLAFGASRADAVACAPGELKPVVRASTVNQGLGSYTPLTRGKEALLRVYLSLPACAASADYIEATGGSVTVSGGNPAPAPVLTPDPGQGPYARIAPYTQAPLADVPADLKWVIPGIALDKAGDTGQVTITFAVTINYKVHANGAALGVNGSSVPPYTTTAIVGPPSNNIRILVVPMGNGSDLSGAQFPAAATQTVQNGMRTVSRTFPVKDGVGELVVPNNGVRFSLMPTMLDIGPNGKYSAMRVDADGVYRFCGTDANFPQIKAGLDDTLSSWNQANPGNGADRVLGVVWEGFSRGAPSCYEGLANSNAKQAWARIVADKPGAPSPAGGIMAHELFHTLGGVHSTTDNPDATAPNRAYNVAARQFLAGPGAPGPNDRNIMNFAPPAWDNTNVLFEQTAWALALCELTPSAMTCPNPGAIGTAAAAQLDGFVITGRAPASNPRRPDDVHSYVAPSVRERTKEDPAGAIHVKQFQSNGLAVVGPLADKRFQATTVSSENPSFNYTDTILDLVVDLNPDAYHVQVTRDGVATPLYTADRTGKPVIVVTHRSESNLTQTSQNEGKPALSPNGALAAWVDGSDIKLRLVTGTQVSSVQGTDPDIYQDSTGKLGLVFIRNGNVLLADLSPAGAVSNERTIYLTADQTTLTNAAASHPSADPTGSRYVVSIDKNLYVLSPSLVPNNKVVCSLSAASSVGCALTVSTGDATVPSWSSATSSDVIAYQRSVAGQSAPSVWKYVGGVPSSTTLVEDAATAPSTNGATIAYTKAGVGITLEGATGATSQATIFATDTSAALADDEKTFVFDRTVSGQHDIFFSVEDPNNTTVTASDDNSGDDLLYAYASTGPSSGDMPVLVAEPPTSFSNGVAQWNVTLPASGIPQGSTISYFVTDHFLTSERSNGGTAGAAVGARGSILVPADGAALLQYDAIPATGLITHPDGSAFADSDHLWTVTCTGGFSRSGTGRSLADIQPPTPQGLPVGPCTIVLSAKTGLSSSVEVDRASFTILADADHDGIERGRDIACSGSNGDNDAGNAFADPDGDGMPNISDPDCLVSANTVSVDFDPNTLNIGSSGTPVTTYITAPTGRDLRTVSPSSVRITQIAGYSVSISKAYWSAGSATSATAQFDRQTVNQFFANHRDLIGQKVLVVIAGAGQGFTMRGFDPNAPLVSN
jgi:hypothetical protein